MRLKQGIVSIVISPAIVLAGQAPSKPTMDAKSLIGSWEGIDSKGIKGAFQFQPDGTASLTIDGQHLGGATPNGPSMKYEVDSSKTPMWLDIVGYDAQGVERLRMKCIFQMTGPKELRVAISDSPNTRPSKLDQMDSSNTLTLKKVD